MDPGFGLRPPQDDERRLEENGVVPLPLDGGGSRWEWSSGSRNSDVGSQTSLRESPPSSLAPSQLERVGKVCLSAALSFFALAAPAFATEVQYQPPVSNGEVRVPLADYTEMLKQLGKEPRRAPAAYAIGQSNVTVRISEDDDRFAATVWVTTLIETFEDEWTLVPILPNGVALKSATVDGRAAQLVQAPEGLAWSSHSAGLVTLQLSYGLDATRSEAGFQLPLAVPQAAATALSLDFPGPEPDLAIVPGADLKSHPSGEMTRFTASIPATSSILVTWRAASKEPYAVSRAAYDGRLLEEALVWTARFQVEVFSGEEVKLPLLPSGVTLNDLKIDGRAATVLEDEGFFTTVLQGRGLHEVEATFQVPVTENGGPPQALLPVPRIPVSRFDLVLPGRKDVKVLPGGGHVASEERGEETHATVFLPLTNQVIFSWTDAIPEDLRSEVRATASLYHAVHAEEGVLHGHASVVYEITRGETSLLELEIPEAAQVNRIAAPGLLDWTEAAAETAGRKKISVFLELPVSGEVLVEVFYERLLGIAAGGEAVAVPLLSAGQVHRQRGMVALLSGNELTLNPTEERDLSRVGENQLPAFLRNQITMTVAHTFKYTSTAPTLAVEAVAPERRQGIFDAQVDTLISLGDVTMKGSATIEIDVKSGSLLDLELRLPAGVNVLGVTGPSLRRHQVTEVEDGQAIALEFTREMEGQFRIEVNYERIMETEAPESLVPRIAVEGAEVAHGRIAVEALTAVEVRASASQQLSNLDINELPQQLVLKTTNPILLAFRYLQQDFRLALTITRHKEIQVQVAAIERADYNSLYTRDGLVVTTARLTVRNSRRQFLRLDLPEGSEVWSVFVDGKPEKPAYASGDLAEGSAAVLIRMINSAKGFPVEVVYATPLKGIGHIGSVGGQLPRPDMVVTQSRWNVYLPAGPTYSRVDSSMDVVVRGRWTNPRAASAAELKRAADAAQVQMGQPLRINVPTRGVLFAFEKLYANRSAEEAAFSIRYVSAEGNYAGLLMSLAGVCFLWLGILALGTERIKLPRKPAVAVLGAGVLALIGSIGYLGSSPAPASLLALVIALVLAVWWAAAKLRDWRRNRKSGAEVIPG